MTDTTTTDDMFPTPPPELAPSDDAPHGPGHNSGNRGGIAGERLKAFLERVKKLDEEKAALAADIKDVYAEAKSAGFDVKIMRQIVRLRKMDEHKRKEAEELLDLYKSAIGME